MATYAIDVLVYEYRGDGPPFREGKDQVLQKSGGATADNPDQAIEKFVKERLLDPAWHHPDDYEESKERSDREMDEQIAAGNFRDLGGGVLSVGPPGWEDQ